MTSFMEQGSGFAQPRDETCCGCNWTVQTCGPLSHSLPHSLTYDLQIDPGVPGRRLAEVDAAAVRAPVLLAQVVDPEDGGVGRGVVLEARAGAQVHAVVPVPPDGHPVAAHVEAEEGGGGAAELGVLPLACWAEESLSPFITSLKLHPSVGKPSNPLLPPSGFLLFCCHHPQWQIIRHYGPICLLLVCLLPLRIADGPAFERQTGRQRTREGKTSGLIFI